MGWLDNWKDEGRARIDVIPRGYVDLSKASILFDVKQSKRFETYANIAKKKIYAGSRCDVLVNKESQENPRIRLEISNAVHHDEGYSIIKLRTSSTYTISGKTDRGVLFGLGRFLRDVLSLDFYQSYGTALQKRCIAPDEVHIVSSPDYRMRQHQIAYRPKTNAYDAFTAQQMRDEVTDLALFGTNGIEMIPPGIDDAMQSPHFTISWTKMLFVVSEWCDCLDLNVSIWYPAFFKNYDDLDMSRKAEAHWNEIFSSLKRLDVLFVPGGDPGGRAPKELFKIVERQAKFMRERFFPRCEVWVSSQYGLSTSVDLGLLDRWVPLERELEWIRMIGTAHVRSFVNGAVYGPWSSLPISEFREHLHKDLPLRNYPDICHVQTCEMPCQNWDLSFATTHSRESINPRPREMARIIQIQAPHTIGCGCYSEGVNDDVNKYVWTALHWGKDEVGPLSEADVEAQLQSLLIQYASFLAGLSTRSQAELLAEGIFCLEMNWNEPLRKGKSVERSIAIFDKIEKNLHPLNRKNWRLNLLMLRATHDAFLYSRLRQEMSMAASALVHMRTSSSSPLSKRTLRNVVKSMQGSYDSKAVVVSDFDKERSPFRSGVNVLSIKTCALSITHLYARVISLCSVLYEQIGYQTSIGLAGQHRQRGAYIDLAWTPLGDVHYLNLVLNHLISSSDSSPDKEISALVQKFTDSFMERFDMSSREVLWYASFGDESANECPGSIVPPTRSQPIHEVLSPHRKFQHGEDPVCFQRTQVEFMDTSSDVLLKKIHEGRVPRAWRSSIISIVPRTANLTMKFEMQKLLYRRTSSVPKLSIRVTYLMNDLNIHGGDWDELGRRAMGTKLEANGVLIHDYLRSQRVTRTMLFPVPDEAVRLALKTGTLTFRWIPEHPRNVTFVDIPLPIAEFWVLHDKAAPHSNL